MAITWYGNQSTAETCHLGALAVIRPLLERMQVERIIDRHCQRDPQAEFSHGRILSLLMAARLYSPVALVNVPTWAAKSGADILWDIPVEKLNDDRLGRSLDAFFAQRHSILASVALHVSEEFGVCLSELHYDPTHVVLYGAYASSEPRKKWAVGEQMRSDEALSPAHITHGHPMTDVPKNVRVIHAGLCTVVDELGPLPIFGHTVGGDQNGHTAVAEQLALIKKHLKPPALTMLSDRGTFSAGHLLRLAESGYEAIAAAPWDDFRALFDAHHATLQWKEATYLSIEQKRRRTQGSLPQEHYELAVVRHELTERSSRKTIPCRAIFVFSTADEKVARENREKSIRKIQEGLEKITRSVAEGRRYTDPESIARRVGKLFGKRQAAAYFDYQMIPLTESQREQLPPPQPRCRRPTHRFEFTYDPKAAERDARYEGYSVLVTTAKATQSADVLFTKYKQQCYSELANHELKKPLAVHPVFLKSPRRVEALLFLLMLSLTLYFLIQRIYRQNLPEGASTKEQRTTTQTILREFHSYALILYQTSLGREVQASRLTARQCQILRQLGFQTPAEILSQQLPRAP